MPQTAIQPISGAVLAAHSACRKVRHAPARPGSVQPVPPGPAAPAPLAAAAAAIALTLCDHDTPVWLDAAFAGDAVTQWLRFNTGCPIVTDQAQSAFALAGDLAALPQLE